MEKHIQQTLFKREIPEIPGVTNSEHLPVHGFGLPHNVDPNGAPEMEKLNQLFKSLPFEEMVNYVRQQQARIRFGEYDQANQTTTTITTT